EVRNLAHETMRETRELARGYRPVDLGKELDGARSLLRSAGIDVDLDVGAVPTDWQEPAAWVVREAVTNVLRHSTATRVSIRFAPPELIVTNDRASAGGGRSGNGVIGLRERLAPLGASLTTHQVGDSFALTAQFPQSSSAGVDHE
ncbi:MAG: hypothetical protein L0H31_06765, partial [Nocardioidaceae bacterium]|nr:hypothetical protein [Nocardioidaceae bacterium]